MRKTWLVSLLLILIAGYVLYSCNTAKRSPEKVIGDQLVAEIDSFSSLTDKFLTAAEDSRTSVQRLRQLFLETRLAYKKFEWAAEYFTWDVTRTVNGQPVPEVELSGHVLEPAGLQVIETFLYPKYDIDKKDELIRQIRSLQSSCDLYRRYFKNVAILDWQVFDASKLEVFRVLTLGITGFDAPLSENSMNEAAAALGGLSSALDQYSNVRQTNNALIKLKTAIAYLQKNKDFNIFDRAAFITGYGNAITIALSHWQRSLNLPVVKYNRLLRQDAKTLFDPDAFDANAFVPAPRYAATYKKIALGKRLFSDPVLSGPETRSCASCHQPGRAFTDGLVKNTVIGNPKALVARNTPTLLNAALQSVQFYDQRASTLEDQVSDVVNSGTEMHGSLKTAIKRLWNDQEYRRLFSEAFPEKNRTRIDTFEVMNAIGSYVRSLVALNSRFDRYMRGDKTAMSEQEIDGFNLFMGKAKCATCHYMPLFNGMLPPVYLKTDPEVIGVPASLKYQAVDKDMGRFGISHFIFFKHAFKTPTLRNAALTAPYMHNGVFKTLDEVVDFYNKGGGAGEGLNIDDQTLPANKLNLCGKEIKALIAFIGTLNSN